MVSVPKGQKNGSLTFSLTPDLFPASLIAELRFRPAGKLFPIIPLVKEVGAWETKRKVISFPVLERKEEEGTYTVKNRMKVRLLQQ